MQPIDLEHLVPKENKNGAPLKELISEKKGFYYQIVTDFIYSKAPLIHHQIISASQNQCDTS